MEVAGAVVIEWAPWAFGDPSLSGPTKGPLEYQRLNLGVD